MSELWIRSLQLGGFQSTATAVLAASAVRAIADSGSRGACEATRKLKQNAQFLRFRSIAVVWHVKIMGGERSAC